VGVAGGQHQRIAFAQRHIELLGQGEQQPAAGTGTARLDEAEVAGRDAGIQREIELAAPPALPPLAQQRTSLFTPAGHEADVSPAATPRLLPAR
jgi:hypothetical protein